MRLNTIKPQEGSKPAARRLGRGIGSGLGKTGGRGHKGLKSRSGGKVRAGFEGGQTALARRLPKRGFTSRVGLTSAKVRLSELAKISADLIDMSALKQAGLVTKDTLQARIFLSGAIDRAVTIEGLTVTKGAKEAIEAAGGSIKDVK